LRLKVVWFSVRRKKVMEIVEVLLESALILTTTKKGWGVIVLLAAFIAVVVWNL
jgi:hypothetical protein